MSIGFCTNCRFCGNAVEFIVDVARIGFNFDRDDVAAEWKRHPQLGTVGEVLDLLSASADTPNRLSKYRRYSALYGRFDAKRKPDKVVKDAGYHYAKASRKRGFDVVDSHSPQSSPTQSPCPGEDNDAEADVFSTAKQSEEKRKKSESAQEKSTYLERWASSMLASQQSASNSPSGTQ
ncbi:unnamed protein product [Cylicocyclus nassatus]|uniref:NAB co-repressor domain-containing protein n=1 Tax=Cylicocyclus nassatus TaxID=53992 RepID=A0AA36H7E1_CYLNA|nr:unnamed protein product [Cylicocyclus nassatus]